MYYTQLQRERDAVLQESLQLQTELEEERRQREKDRDEIAELRDRADNLKVQAQGKLVRMPNMYYTYLLPEMFLGVPLLHKKF